MLMQTELQKLDKEGKLILEVEKLMDQCPLAIWNKTIMAYLIKWKSMSL